VSDVPPDASISSADDDLFTQEIIKEALVAIGDEMFDAMIRTSMSPVVYETHDFAVGVTDASGNLIAQGSGDAGFLAMLDTTVQATLQRYKDPKAIRPGDVIISNMPYEGGGTHLSDIAIVMPIFVGEQLIAWTVNKSHWTEVGGACAGSVSTEATEIFQEGIQFPFVKLFEESRPNEVLIDIIRANVRLPESTLGDMHAGVAAARVGARRLLELVTRYTLPAVVTAMASVLDYGERMMRDALSRLPPGVYEAEDVVEHDGIGNGPFRLRVRVTVGEDGIIADFSGTDRQAGGPINCSYSGLVTAARCVLAALSDSTMPANGGSFRLLRVICPPGTFVSAQSPAPVSVYYEALVAAIDVMWKALAPAARLSLPAGHMRSVCVTYISGRQPKTGELYVLSEPLAGGWGGSNQCDGDGGQFSCGNGDTFNIPVELFEFRYGLKVEQYAFHNEPGGAGRFRGGKGVVLDYRVLDNEVFVTYAASRCVEPPWPLEGGQPGSLNRLEVTRQNGSIETHVMCTRLRVEPGELIRLITATGGGFGDPAQRSSANIADDLRNGFITLDQARVDYGYVPLPGN
jgi:N-methylhydantoinase B